MKIWQTYKGIHTYYLMLYFPFDRPIIYESCFYKINFESDEGGVTAAVVKFAMKIANFTMTNLEQITHIKAPENFENKKNYYISNHKNLV